MRVFQGAPVSFSPRRSDFSNLFASGIPSRLKRSEAAAGRSIGAFCEMIQNGRARCAILNLLGYSRH
jgi:hypothetical protein